MDALLSKENSSDINEIEMAPPPVPVAQPYNQHATPPNLAVSRLPSLSTLGNEAVSQSWMFAAATPYLTSLEVGGLGSPNHSRIQRRTGNEPEASHGDLPWSRSSTGQYQFGRMGNAVPTNERDIIMDDIQMILKPKSKSEVSYDCPFIGCEKKFTRGINLKDHLRSHQEGKPFVCHWPGCGKGFARQHDCKRHEQLHITFQPFICGGCGKQFARKDALNRHLHTDGNIHCLQLREAIRSPLAGKKAAVTVLDIELQSQLFSYSQMPRSAYCRSLVSGLLWDRNQTARICRLRGGDAQIVADYLDIVSREASIFQVEERRRALSLLCKLAKSAGVFPRCYELTGIDYNMEPIAGGRFAEVCQGRYKEQMLSLKVVRVYQRQESDEILKTHVQELALWAHLQHKNILPFYGVYFLGASPRICLVSPWMEKGNLRDYFRKFPHKSRMPFISDIADGLLYLHDLHIVHSDLKAENILVSDDEQALIADFGLSSIKATTTLSAAGGTTRFMAPELLIGDAKISEKCDIWSFACLCYEIFTNKIPFYQYKDTQIISVLLRKEIPLRPTYPSGTSQELGDKMWGLLTSCWDGLPQNRPNCAEIRDSIRDLGVPSDRRGVIAGIEVGSAFWQAMREKSGSRLDYSHLEEVLRRVSNGIIR